MPESFAFRNLWRATPRSQCTNTPRAHPARIRSLECTNWSSGELPCEKRNSSAVDTLDFLIQVQEQAPGASALHHLETCMYAAQCKLVKRAGNSTSGHSTSAPSAGGAARDPLLPASWRTPKPLQLNMKQPLSIQEALPGPRQRQILGNRGMLWASAPSSGAPLQAPPALQRGPAALRWRALRRAAAAARKRIARPAEAARPGERSRGPGRRSQAQPKLRIRRGRASSQVLEIKRRNRLEHRPCEKTSDAENPQQVSGLLMS